MSSTDIEYTIWALSACVSLVTAAQLWRRDPLRRHRIFLIYLCLVGSHGLINIALSLTNPLWWFYSFYAGNLLTTLLAFAVLFETAKHALSARSFRLSRLAFLVLCALNAVIAVIIVANTEANGPLFIRARILLEVALRIMQVGLLGIFALVSLYFGFFWKRREFGIVLGYGIYAIAQILVMYLRAGSANTTDRVLLFAPVISYFVASIVWLLYASAREITVDEDVERLSAEIDRTVEFAQSLRP